MKKTDTEILNAAKLEARLWVDGFAPNGEFDIPGIQSILEKRKSEHGEAVSVYMFRSPTELNASIDDIINKHATSPEEAAEVRKNAHRCVWDYYLMAFYESAYHQLEVQDHWFMKESLFPAYELGLGWLVNLDTVLLGVTLPLAHLDEDGRLHWEDGPAIVWGDGTKAYWWHGISIPEAWIEDKDSVDLRAEFRSDSNAERRRVMSECFGWDRVAKALGATTLQQDDYGKLIECEIEEGEPPWKMVAVVCPSTDRAYTIPVPPETQTCREGLAWTAGVAEEDYCPKVET